MTEAPYFSTLPNRGLVKVSGADARSFLQGLISNNINLLDKQASVYACLLTAQGKFLHDFFISEQDGIILLECEGGARAEDLAKRLSMYKLRAQVTIDCFKEWEVYAVIGKELGVPDPRHWDLGYRTFEKPDEIEEKPFDAWDHHRILLTIPDGSRDMIVDKSTLMESNIDKLNGIDFNKGCYIGQELTARMHYRALVKKRLQTVKMPYTGHGELRSNCGDVGIALEKI